MRSGLDLEHYRALIRAAAPGVEARDVRFLGSGWDSVALLVDDAFVFRFPMRDEVAAMLEAERCLLPRLAPSLPLAVPRFLFTGGPLPAFPRRFVGYPVLPGTPIAELPDVALDPHRIGQALGRFLRALHAAPIDDAVRCGVPVYTPEQWVERHWRLAEATLPVIEQGLGGAAADRVRSFWSDYCNDPRSRHFTPVIVHADLNPDHVLVDPRTGDVTGIIDFGDVCVGDPAIDFAGMPAQVTEAMRRAYDDSDPTFAYRVMAHVLAVPLHGIDFGRQSGEDAIVAAALSDLAALLER